MDKHKKTTDKSSKKYGKPRLPVPAAFLCAAAVLALAGFLGMRYFAEMGHGTGLALADDYIAGLKRYQSKSVELKEHRDGYTYYDVVKTKNLGEYMLNRAGNTVIYPGAVFRGDSLMQGTTDYTLVTQKRTPMTLSCNPGGKSLQIEDITYGTVSAAVEKFCKETGLKCQQCEYRYYSGHDESYLGGGFGAGGEYKGISADAGVSGGSTEENSRIFLIFTETYFTVKAEPFDRASKYFQIQNVEELESFGEYEPAYVSSVDYGRILVADIQSSKSEQELMGEIDAGTKAYDLNANGFFHYFSGKNDFDCRVYCYGGDLGKSYEEVKITEDNIHQLVAADEALVNPVPVAYHLNYISDNSAVPAMQIAEADEIRKENAKLVTITLEGKHMEGTFQLDDTTAGSVINTDQIKITKKGKATEDIRFIWDTQSAEPELKGSFNGEEVIFSLEGIPMEEDQEVWSMKKHPLLLTIMGFVKIKVRISDMLDEVL